MNVTGRRGAALPGALRLVPVACLAALVAGAVVARVSPRASRAESDPRTCVDVPASARVPAVVTRDLAPLLGPAPPPAALVHAGATQAQHGDARRTHRASASGPLATRVLFAAAVGGAVATQVTTSPDEQTLYVATLAGALVALARDGRERFRVALGGRSYTSPAVAEDGTVFVGSDAGKLFAISPDGHTKFQVELGDEVDVAPLLLASGELVVAAGKQVVWIDRRGNVTRRFEAKRKVFTAPALAGALVVFGAQDDHVYGLSATRGELAFRTPLGADVDGSPAVADDGTIFVGTDAGEVVHLSGDGRVLGRAKVGGFVRGALAIARNGDVVVGTYGPAPKLVRVRDHQVVGGFAVLGTGAKEFGVHGGALEDARGTLYFGAQDDQVYGVSPLGDRVFGFRAGGDVDGPLTLLGDGTLLVPCEDGHVYALGP